MMRRMGRAYLASLLALAGCATEPTPAPIAPPAPIVTDSFCETARKRSWSVKDTAQSIAEARAWNRAIDKRCGVPGS
jgi:uncharacterized lipoprotein YajG